jgi:hypothetical protein
MLFNKCSNVEGDCGGAMVRQKTRQTTDSLDEDDEQ